MPYRPRKPCHHPGCPNLTAGMYCTLHQPQHKPDTQRPSAHRRGYTKRWQTASKSFLLHHPFCVRCRQQGRLTPATVVDHIIPHRGDQKLFWDESNWQALCKPCHDRKTWTEDRFVSYGYGFQP